MLNNAETKLSNKEIDNSSAKNFATFWLKNLTSCSPAASTSLCYKIIISFYIKF